MAFFYAVYMNDFRFKFILLFIFFCLLEGSILVPRCYPFKEVFTLEDVGGEGGGGGEGEWEGRGRGEGGCT
jgi:hypothetical protein